jgi:hypothetical protein
MLLANDVHATRPFICEFARGGNAEQSNNQITTPTIVCALIFTFRRWVPSPIGVRAYHSSSVRSNAACAEGLLQRTGYRTVGQFMARL